MVVGSPISAYGNGYGGANDYRVAVARMATSTSCCALATPCTARVRRSVSVEGPMSGMLPIDRVRATAQKAREQFDRARRRFRQKGAKLDRDARAYDDTTKDEALRDGEVPPEKQEERAP